MDEDTKITSDANGNLYFSTLNLVLTPKLNYGYFVGSWHGVWYQD